MTETYRWEHTFDIPGIKNDASGVTWSPVTGHLYVVVDGPEKIVEITLAGEWVRKVKLKGFEDTEGICHLRDHRFAVVEENEMTVTLFDLPPGDEKVSSKNGIAISLASPLPKDDPSGLEGVSYDAGSDTLYVVKEAEPKEVYVVEGASSEEPVVYASKELREAVADLKDVSDVHYHASEKLLYLLSDRSRAIVRCTLAGEIVDTLSLEKDHLGLPESISDAEGITTDADGNLYICSEPRQIHVFVRRDP